MSFFLSLGFGFGSKEFWHFAKHGTRCALDGLAFGVPENRSHISFILQHPKETFSCSVSVFTKNVGKFVVP